MKTKIFFGQSIAAGAEKAGSDLNEAMERWFDKEGEVRICGVELEIKAVASEVSEDKDIVYFYVTVKIDYTDTSKDLGERMRVFPGQSMDIGVVSVIPFIERSYAKWQEEQGDEVEQLDSILKSAPVVVLCNGVSKVYYYAVLLMLYR